MLGLRMEVSQGIISNWIKRQRLPLICDRCEITETIKACNHNSKWGLILFFFATVYTFFFFFNFWEHAHVLIPLIRTGNPWILICPVDWIIWILHSFLVFEHCGSCKLARWATEWHKSAFISCITRFHFKYLWPHLLLNAN